MEEKLKKLFDFQKFEKNERLNKLIEEAEGSKALTDEEIESVSAASFKRIIDVDPKKLI